MLFAGIRKTNPKFLVLLPIHRPSNLLRFAVNSVLNQTENDFELHIICDGAPNDTQNLAQSMARKNRKITAHIFQKDPGRGEIFRDLIIRESRADFVCQIADDYIWFPDHLSEIGKMLSTCDFGHTLQVEAAPQLRLLPLIGNLSDDETVKKMIFEAFNFFGPTASGYRWETYLKLEEGWTAAPPDVWPDLHMWRKFLRNDKIKRGTRLSFTNLHIARPHHEELSIEVREEINKEWWEWVSDPERLDLLKQKLLKHVFQPTGGSWLELGSGHKH